MSETVDRIQSNLNSIREWLEIGRSLQSQATVHVVVSEIK